MKYQNICGLVLSTVLAFSVPAPAVYASENTEVLFEEELPEIQSEEAEVVFSDEEQEEETSVNVDEELTVAAEQSEPVFVSELTNEENMVSSISEIESLAMKAHLNNGRVIDVSSTGETTAYNGKNWTIINVEFELSDASESENDVICLMPAVNEKDSIQIAFDYDRTTEKLYAPFLEKGEDGYYSNPQIYLPSGENTTAVTQLLYMIVSRENGSKEYYEINVKRKGCRTVTKSEYGVSYSDTVPYVLTKMDFETGEIYGSDNVRMYGYQYKFFDENGNYIRCSQDDLGFVYSDGFTKVGLPYSDIPEEIRLADGKIYAKYPGTYELKWSWGDYQGSLRVIARYRLNKDTLSGLSGLVERQLTDGIVSIRDFKDAESFAAEFPDEWKSKAEITYRYGMELLDVLDYADTNGADETRPGGWDYQYVRYGTWDDSLESMKLASIMQIKEEGLWDHMNDLLKEEIRNYLKPDDYPVSMHEKIQAVVDAEIQKLDAAYKNGVHTKEELYEYVRNAKIALDRVVAENIEKFALNVALERTEYVYDGKAKTPKVTVTDYDGNTVESDRYRLEYRYNVNAGTAQVLVTGNGKYQGTTIQYFTITKAKQTISVTNRTLNLDCGNGKTSVGALVNGDAKLEYSSSNSDVIIVSSKGVLFPVGRGTATITIQAPETWNYQAAEAVTVKVKVTDYVNLRVSKTALSKQYNSKAFSLGVSAESGASVKYQTSNKKVATVSSKGKVTIKAPGKVVITVRAAKNNKDSVTKKITVTITPKQLSISTVKSKASRQLAVSWKRDKTVTGYELMISTDKNFKKNVNKLTTEKNSQVGVTIKKLSGGKKYYVKIRSYKKTNDGIVYGSWSKVKTAKVKK